MKNGLEFKKLDNGYEIATSQTLSEEEFCQRVSNLEVQKTTFEKDIENTKLQIEHLNQRIKTQEKNIVLVTEDLEKAHKFLEKIHKSELSIKIKNDAEAEIKKLQEQSMRQM